MPELVFDGAPVGAGCSVPLNKKDSMVEAIWRIYCATRGYGGYKNWHLATDVARIRILCIRKWFDQSPEMRELIMPVQDEGSVYPRNQDVRFRRPARKDDCAVPKIYNFLFGGVGRIPICPPDVLVHILHFWTRQTCTMIQSWRQSG